VAGERLAARRGAPRRVPVDRSRAPAGRASRIPGLLLPALALLVPAARGQEGPVAEQPLTWDDLSALGSRFRLYGFLRLDAMYDDSRMNDPLIPVYARSEDPSPPPGVPAGVVAEEGDEEFTMSARLTRLGLAFDGPPIEGLGEPELDGKLEIDFYNVGLDDADSRAAIRMRLAYLRLTWGAWELLAGQDWDVISPLYPAVNDDIVHWGSGNTGDRRPQLTGKHTAELGPGRLVSEAGIALAGAVSSSSVVGGLRSGENSGRPMLNARVGYHGETAAGGAYQLGVWGHDAQFEEDLTGTGEQRFDSHSFGVDLALPLVSDRLWTRGEWWTGRNLADVRGGILQGVNPTSGKEIAAEGGFLELGWRAGEHLTVSAGYSLDDPDDGDLAPFMRSRNEAPYASARWRHGPLRFGLEALHWRTEYVGLDAGEAWRAVGWIAYDF